jgi:predicted peptidase
VLLLLEFFDPGDAHAMNFRRVLFLKLVVAAIFIVSPVVHAEEPAAGRMVKVFPDDKKRFFPYWLYLPTEYDANKDHLPVVLFLHGLGERGDNLNRVAAIGLPRLIKNGKHFSFIMVAPQCPNDGSFRDNNATPAPREFWWMPGSVDKAKNVVDQVKAMLGRVDEDRVYVTGLSMGGFGTYNIVNRHPRVFAAAAPICGHGNSWPDKSKVTHIPFWAFHGDNDNVVKLVDQQKTVDSIKAACANVKFTIYPGAGHNSWSKTYANSKLYEWLLSHKRKAHHVR